jgi:uncharacterized protein with HEPN domain
MTQHDPRVCLRQMRDHAQEAIELMRGKSREGLLADRTLNLAIVHLLEILGEAANRMPTEQRAKYPQIPWPQIIGLRHRLIHAYDQVDLDIVWNIVTQHLPPLVRTLDEILSRNS